MDKTRRWLKACAFDRQRGTLLVARRDTPTAGFGLSLVILLAMIVNMSAAALSGAVIPLILKALGRDPAQSAAIFLTTVTDIVGFASFLGLAMLFMQWLV